MVLSANQPLHHGIGRLRALKHAEALSFVKVFNMYYENAAAYVAYGLKIFKQNLNIIPTISLQWS